jgi:hypothetical protein
MAGDKNKTVSTILFVALFTAIGVGGYFVYANNNKKKSASSGNKVDKISVIMQNINKNGLVGNFNFLMGLADAYINDWYSAVVNNQPTFTSGGDKFSTVTGEAIR